MKIGCMITLRKSMDLDAAFEKAASLDLNACQLSCYDIELHTVENAQKVRDASEKYGIEVTALWAGWSGPQEWNFYGGPETLGLVPKAYRFIRMKELMSASDFAELLGVSDIITHVGFLPENPNDPDFMGTVTAIRSIATYMKSKNQYFLFETGQETPVTLLRAIEEIGTNNLGINFDTANLILYGKANPVDALAILGKYVRNTHCKDGLYPTCGNELGKETPVSSGAVDFPAIIAQLKTCGYKGPLIIEREHAGEKQTDDIIHARNVLRSLLSDTAD